MASALATGGLDSAGNLAFPVKRTREEIVGQIMETAEAWGQPMTREQAKAKADAAIGKIQASQFWSWLSVAVIIAAAILLMLAII